MACDDEATARRLAADVQAFKVGIDGFPALGVTSPSPSVAAAPRDRGTFVGGDFLVHAVTQGPADERLFGDFSDYRLEPPT